MNEVRAQVDERFPVATDREASGLEGGAGYEGQLSIRGRVIEIDTLEGADVDVSHAAAATVAAGLASEDCVWIKAIPAEKRRDRR